MVSPVVKLKLLLELAMDKIQEKFDSSHQSFINQQRAQLSMQQIMDQDVLNHQTLQNRQSRSRTLP